VLQAILAISLRSTILLTLRNSFQNLNLLKDILFLIGKKEPGNFLDSIFEAFENSLQHL